MDDVDVLRQVPLFSHMDEPELAGLRQVMQVAEYVPQQVIIREGDPGEVFHVLIHGRAEILMRDASGQEVVVNEIRAGGFFGELSMLTGSPRSARVRAADQVRTLTLARTEFFEFLLRQPHAALDVLKELAGRQYHMDQLLRKSISRNVNQVADEQLTWGQKIADAVADGMGSWPFIIVQSVLLGVWIILNLVAWMSHWDPYPFILLNLALSFQAAYAAPFIMMSQNRQSMTDRLAAEIDHQVNSKAELGVGLLLQRLDEVHRSVEHSLRDVHTLLAASGSSAPDTLPSHTRPTA